MKALKTRNNPSTITKPSNQNHEFAKKMKKPRSSDLDILKNPSLRRYESSDQPRNHPPCTSTIAASSSSSLNYMKSTSCSEAKRELPITVARSFKPSRSTQSANKCSTTTCYSTSKVCSYNHCSLNCHKQDSNPPLKSFLSARRKPEARLCEDVGVHLVVDNETGEAVNVSFVEQKAEFLVEICAKEPEDKAEGVSEVGSDVEEEAGHYLLRLGIGDDISAPNDQESDHTFVHPLGDEILCLLYEEGVKKDDVGIKLLDEFQSEEANEFSQDEITNCRVQFSDSESSVNDYKETEFDQLLQDYGCSDDEKIEESSKSDDQTISTAKISEESSTGFLSNDLRALEDPAHDIENGSEERPPSFGDSDIENPGFVIQASLSDSEETDNFDTKNLSPVESIPPTLEGIELFKKDGSLKTTIRSRKHGEISEALKQFNPRELNYLEVKLDAEAEKVDLRHQEMDERRNTEEWMLDYALRKAVNQLGAARKRKVELLVEAFEIITPN